MEGSNTATVIRDLNPEDIDDLVRSPFEITKMLFTWTENSNFDYFITLIQTYIKLAPANKCTVEQILGIFSLIRPKQHELLEKIEKSILITRSQLKHIFVKVYYEFYHVYILNADHLTSDLPFFIRNDNLKDFQQKVLQVEEFNFEIDFELPKKPIQIFSSSINLIELAAYYGSVQCFKYLMLNDVKISQNVPPFAIAGGNYEIIHLIENQPNQFDFSSVDCFNMSIAFHQYAITDWLILNYNHDPDNAKMTEIAAYFYNYPVYLLYFTRNESHFYKNINLWAVCISGCLPLVQYLCEKKYINNSVRR